MHGQQSIKKSAFVKIMSNSKMVHNLFLVSTTSESGILWKERRSTGTEATRSSMFNMTFEVTGALAALLR